MQTEDSELITLTRDEMERFLVQLHWAANRFTKYTVNAVVRQFTEDHNFNYAEIRRIASAI